MHFHNARRSSLLLVLALGIAGVAVACGGGSTTSSTSATKATGGVAKAETIQVSMKDNVFVPKDMSASIGETITFELRNDGLTVHDMHFLNDTTEPRSAVSAPIAAGDTGKFVVKFTKAGALKFQCDFHTPDMVGTVTVK